MLQIYGNPLSSPTNKVRYVANYLNIPYEFKFINLGAGEHLRPEYLKINPYGRVPLIDDEGFKLAESNAIIRYFANKQQSSLYPKELQQRAIVDQWIDFGSQHVMLALGRIMFNTYFYKFARVAQDERALQDGKKYIANYLPIVEQQLGRNLFIAGDVLSLADFVMLSALDSAELLHVDLGTYSHIIEWRDKLMKETFYTGCHENFASSFNKVLAEVSA